MTYRPFVVSLFLAAGLLAPAAPSVAAEVALHPFCVQQLLYVGETHFEGETERALPATPCNHHYQKAPVKLSGDFYVAERKSLKDPRKPRAPFYQYQVAGMHRNVTIANVAEGVGDATVYSSIGFFLGWPVSESRDQLEATTQVSLLGMFEGGDRCNGGFVSAKITDGATLRIGENLTPYDLFVYRPARAILRNKAGTYDVIQNEDASVIPEKLLAIEPRRDLDAAPTSCLGVANVDYQLNFGTAKLVSVTLNKPVDRDAGKYKYQACFNKVVRAAVPSFPKTLSPGELLALSGAFTDECLKGTAS